MPGNVLESVIADILITYYTDQDNGYWSHQKNRESIDLIYHSNNLFFITFNNVFIAKFKSSILKECLNG